MNVVGYIKDHYNYEMDCAVSVRKKSGIKNMDSPKQEKSMPTCGECGCDCGWDDSVHETCSVCMVRDYRDNSWRDTDDL